MGMNKRERLVLRQTLAAVLAVMAFLVIFVAAGTSDYYDPLIRPEVGSAPTGAIIILMVVALILGIVAAFLSRHPKNRKVYRFGRFHWPPFI